MEKVLYRVTSKYVQKCFHKQKLYVRDEDKLIIFSGDDHETHNIGEPGGPSHLVSVDTGVVITTENDVILFTDEGSIATLIKDMEDEIRDIVALIGGAIVISTVRDPAPRHP